MTYLSRTIDAEYDIDLDDVLEFIEDCESYELSKIIAEVKSKGEPFRQLSFTGDLIDSYWLDALMNLKELFPNPFKAMEKIKQFT